LDIYGLYFMFGHTKIGEKRGRERNMYSRH